MPTEHALNVVALGITNDGLFVRADEADGVFDPSLHCFTKRPITEAENAPDGVHQRVKAEKKLVAHVAEEGEPPDVLHHRVELMPMQNEEAAPVGRGMHSVLLDRDCAICAKMAGEKFVVIPGNIDNPRAFARFAQDLLDDVIVLLRPINSPAQ